MALLDFEHVSRGYPDGVGGSRLVLDGIDLSLAAGEIAAIIGPSGAGKTTLLYLASGLCHPSAGRVIFEGKNLAETGAGELARVRRDRIGLVFQNSLCLSAVPVWENAALPLLLAGASLAAARERAMELLETVELTRWANATTGVLSGGQRQRLGLARAMAAKPSLLLADEPTADLDIHTAERIERRLFQWLAAENCAALIVTHSATVERAVPQVYRLEEGKLHAMAR